MKRKALITLILGTTLAVAPAARAAVMSDGGGSSSPVVLHADAFGGGSSALMTRDEALNQRYGNAVTRLTPQEFKALYQAGGDRLTPQELAALVARGEALNGRYGGTPAVSTPIATGGDPVNWGAAIGGAALTCAMLLALGFAVVTRRKHRLSF
jgi:hypothetical protein